VGLDGGFQVVGGSLGEFDGVPVYDKVDVERCAVKEEIA
jgi:hypothetical protein